VHVCVRACVFALCACGGASLCACMIQISCAPVFAWSEGITFEIHSNTLPHSATHCNTLPHTATYGSTLQCHTLPHTAIHCNNTRCAHAFNCQEVVSYFWHTATHCHRLEHTATHCNNTRCALTHCNTLQHTATHCQPTRCADVSACQEGVCHSVAHDWKTNDV